MASIAIGVDVGATKIALAAVTLSGEVMGARQTATHVEEGVDAVITRLAWEVGELAADWPEALCGVGIGVPGLVNPREGIVLNAVNMGWQNVPLRTLVENRLAQTVPVHIENDVRGAALGEAWFGAGRGTKDFVLLALGSGLGSAAMVNGQVVHGAHFFASEVGHLVLDVNGRRCNCGLDGCAETVLSGPGLIATVREMIGAGVPTGLSDRELLTTHEVLQAARMGDAAALKALDKVGEWLGIVMATATAWLNPERIVIGGGFGLAAFDLIVGRARTEYARRVLRSSQQGVEIVRSEVASSAVGAAALVFASRGNAR